MAEQQEMLDAALQVVRSSSSQMRKCLESKGKLMDALKHASTMLSELRTSAIGPKQYYELYMAVFDSMRFLASVLKENHPTNHLADLYELSQYAGNLVPRLYLMVTVGAVYMSVPDAPVREIMRDMMEMTRGAQHPIRGLFLRHYLSGQARENLPLGSSDGPEGNLQDSITFILTNFVEMNKLWVRLQHQGHSREREKREQERRELQSLVGTNLVRLSQLEGITLELYKSTILPAILEQVIQCRDVLAQEYLLEVVTQVFPDDYHLRTLDQLLSTIARLNPRSNFRQIIVGLIDRLAAFAAREAESESQEEKKEKDGEANSRLSDNLRKLKLKEKVTDDSELGGSNGYGDETFRGIPTEVRLFEVFWEQLVNLVKARSDLPIQDITALLVSICNMALNCYPNRVDYVDQILEFANQKTQEYADSTDLHSPACANNLLALLLAPISSYPTLLTVLGLPNYLPLLNSQAIGTKRAVGAAVAHSILENATILSDAAEVDGVLGLVSVFIKESAENATSIPGAKRNLETEEVLEETGWLARLTHLISSPDNDTQLTLLRTVRKTYAEAGDRIRYTMPALVTCCIRLARRIKQSERQDPDWKTKATAVYKLIHQIISSIVNRGIYLEGCLRLYVFAGQVADQGTFEDLAYEFFAQAFTIYEESISDSKAQFEALATISGALQTTRNFSKENYDTLITQCAVHGSKLLKKPDQCRMIYLVSHLWWATEIPAREEDNSQEVSLSAI